MGVEVVMGEPEENPEVEAPDAQQQNPDEFFAKNAFRIVYQTNNFFLPQIRDLIDKGEVLNLRPEYQRRPRVRSMKSKASLRVLTELHQTIKVLGAVERVGEFDGDALVFSAYAACFQDVEFR